MDGNMHPWSHAYTATSFYGRVQLAGGSIEVYASFLATATNIIDSLVNHCQHASLMVVAACARSF